jgi:hypothetical protein
MARKQKKKPDTKSKKKKPIKVFDVSRYNKDPQGLVDGSDALANKKELVISFYHVPSGRTVYFKAFISAFTETYNSNFTPNEVFGRTDPIYQYKNTTRKISLTFVVPAASEGEAYENLGRVSALEQMLYPNYTDVGNALSLAQAPLVRLKVMNILQKAPVEQPISFSGEELKVPGPEEQYTLYQSNAESNLGMLGVIDNLSVNHNLNGDEGVFHKQRPVRNEEGQIIRYENVPNTILPKNIELSLAFSPIHEQTIGWDGDQPTNTLFPYGADTDVTRGGEAIDALPSAKARTQKARDAELKRKAIQQMKDNKESGFADLKERLKMFGDSRKLLGGRNNTGDPIMNTLVDEALENAVEAGEGYGDQFVGDLV